MKYGAEKQIRTWRSWFEGASEDLRGKVLPVALRHCAWQMTHRHVRSDGKKQIERLRGRQSRGRVPECVEVDHFRDTQRVAGTSKLCDEWSLRLWMEQMLVSDGHHGVHQREFAGVDPSGNPEDLRWVKRELNEIIGESWNDKLRSERHSGTSDQVWWTDRLHGVLQVRWSESARFANTVTGHGER